MSRPDLSGAKWKDSTSYSQSAPRGTVEPRSWDLDTKSLRITVHRLHGLPDAWFVSAYDLSFERHDLHTTDLVVAKERALEMVRARLTRYLAELDKIAPLRVTEGDQRT